MQRDDPAFAGQRDYTPRVLGAYDRVVIGFVSWFVWRCPPAPLVERYRRQIRNDHLEVGPGTGWFVAHSGLAPRSRVTLLDPNPNVLAHASRALQAFDVTAVEADALKPFPVSGPFQSAALHLVIHCLPGPMSRKAAAIANIAAVLAADGVLFGATVLGRSAHHSWLARRVLWLFNRQGGFDNLDDTEAGLREALATSFNEVELDTIGGSIAVFSARRPRASTRQTA